MKKVFALILALIMVLSLAACGAKAPEAPKAEEPKVEAPAETPKEETPAEPAGPEVPALKGPGNVTLKRLGANVALDVNNAWGAKIIEESTGYKTEYFVLPSENADEKLLMDVAGGASYDAINITIGQFRQLLAQGALQPLDDLLEVYGQAILNAGHPAEVWDALRGEDGHIYAVPYLYPHPHEIANFFTVRKDLTTAAGITEMPKTLDEFYNMLVTLKNYYGDQYIICAGPFYQASEANEAWAVPKTITSAFGIYSDWMVNDAGEVIHITEHENFPALLDFMAKLQSEGLIDPDWAVNNEATLKEKFSSGKVIVCAANRGLADYAVPALMANHNVGWDDLDYITALIGEDGTCTYMETTNFNFVTAIPKSSPNAADVVNWWNLRIQDDLHITIGDEGVHFNYDENGGIDPINPIFADERGDSYWYMDVSTYTWGTEMWPSRVRKSAGQWHAFSRVTMNAPDYIEFTTNEFKFKPATENFSLYNVALFNDTMDFLKQVMAGTRTSADIEAFHSDLVVAGLDDVRVELQEYYDAK